MFLKRLIIFLVLLAFPIGLYADNYKPGDGPEPKTFGSDDISDIHYPRVKIVEDVNGSQADVSSSNGNLWSSIYSDIIS